MDKALYIAMTGAKHNILSQTARSNNLANVSTTGFKAEFVQAESNPVFYGAGQPSRAYAVAESVGSNFSNGPLIQTGNNLDIAVQQEGFLVVQANDGTEALTRAGSLSVDALGVLRNGNGLPVLGNGGPIAIPAAQSIDIGADGSISIVPLGGNPNAPATVDRLRLVNPDVRDLQKAQDGLFRFANPEAELEVDANVRVVAGFLEGSNVNPIDELVSVLGLARQYEMHVRVMQTAEENSEASARLLQQT